MLKVCAPFGSLNWYRAKETFCMSSFLDYVPSYVLWILNWKHIDIKVSFGRRCDSEDEDEDFQSSVENMKTTDDRCRPNDWVLLNPSRRSRALISTVIKKDDSKWHNYDEEDLSKSKETEHQYDRKPSLKRKADELERDKFSQEKSKEDLPTFGLYDACNYLSKAYKFNWHISHLQAGALPSPWEAHMAIWKKVKCC